MHRGYSWLGVVDLNGQNVSVQIILSTTQKCTQPVLCLFCPVLHSSSAVSVDEETVSNVPQLMKSIIKRVSALHEVFKLRLWFMQHSIRFAKARTSLLHFKHLCLGEVLLRSDVILHRQSRCGYKDLASRTVEQHIFHHVVVFLQSWKRTLIYGSATLPAFKYQDFL